MAKVESDILCQIWRNPSPPIGREHDYSLCRTYISRIAAIAAATCHDDTPLKAPTESDFINLSHEYLGVIEPITDNLFFSQQEGPRFLTALQQHEVFRNHIPTADAVHAYAARLTMLRTIRAQWNHIAVSTIGVLRAWDIASRLNTKHHGWIFDRLKIALNIDPKDHIRAGLAILADVTGTGGPGITVPRRLKIKEEVTSTLNLDNEALLLVANRLAQSCDDLRHWHQEEVSAIPEPYRKYAPHPLVAQPLIRLDEGFRNWKNDEIGFLCISPSHLLWNIQSACIESIRKLPKHDSAENLMGELGDCLSSYLHSFLSSTCGHESVIELDKTSNQKEKHADFVVVAGDLALIIESKTSLGSTSAKSVISPEDTVAVWGRLLRAYQQCAHTINSDIWMRTPSLGQVKRFASIVCFDETMCPEGAAFNDYGVNSGLFGALNIGPTEAISLQELEDLIGTFGAKHLGNMILSKWASNKWGDMLRRFAEHTAPDTKILSPTSHLRDAATELLPGNNLPDFTSDTPPVTR